MLMVQLAELIAKHKAATRMVLTVHDELVFYVPAVELELVGETKQIMETPSIDLVVPLVADTEFSLSNLGEMTKGFQMSRRPCLARAWKGSLRRFRYGGA